MVREIALACTVGIDYEDIEAVCIAALLHVGDLAPVRRPGRRATATGAALSQASRAAPVRIHDVDLRERVAHGLEGDTRPVRRPGRVRFERRAVRQVTLARAVNVD